MGGELCINNDRSNDFEILQATIFTPGQGICLQRVTPGKSTTFKFDKSLAYGSWYDIQIIGKNLKNNTDARYLKKGVYLTHGKIIKMTELTNEGNRDYGIEWICDNCKKWRWNIFKWSETEQKMVFIKKSSTYSQKSYQ